MARKSKYEEYIKLFLKDITEWSKSGATDNEISNALGVGRSTFAEYKNRHPELRDALRVGRQNVVLNIKASLYKLATGFKYEEKKGVRKNGEITNIEIYERYCPPNERAAAMLLRNYDKTWVDKDNATTEFKKQEMELKKKIAEANNFFMDE